MTDLFLRRGVGHGRLAGAERGAARTPTQRVGRRIGESASAPSRSTGPWRKWLRPCCTRWRASPTSRMRARACATTATTERREHLQNHVRAGRAARGIPAGAETEDADADIAGIPASAPGFLLCWKIACRRLEWMWSFSMWTTRSVSLWNRYTIPGRSRSIRSANSFRYTQRFILSASAASSRPFSARTLSSFS